MKITEYKEIRGYTFSSDPKKFVNELQQLIDKHNPTAIELRSIDDYEDSHYACFEFSIEREETPIEIKKRQELEAARLANRKKQYEMLKKEFERTK